MESVKLLTLREARQRRGWTQEQLADASGVEQSNISAIERGITRDPNTSTALKLAAALELDPRVLKFGHTEAAVS